MYKGKLSRRSFVAAVTGGAAATFSSGHSAAQTYTGVTDSDGGTYADRVGYGRSGRAATGVTDSDLGANADPINAGRGTGARNNCTGVTDSDVGSGYDPVGCGTGGRAQQPVGPSNSAECQAMRVQMDTLAQRYAGYVVRFSNANQQFDYYLNTARTAFAVGNRPAYAAALEGLTQASSGLRAAFNGMTATEAGLTGLMETAEVFC
jgi:hypothetical protein